jgi:hypothetical protein
MNWTRKAQQQYKRYVAFCKGEKPQLTKIFLKNMVKLFAQIPLSMGLCPNTAYEQHKFLPVNADGVNNQQNQWWDGCVLF